MSPEEKKKLAQLQEAIAELDRLEAPILENIAEAEEAMRRQSARLDNLHRRLAEIGDLWADRLDVDLPGWRAILKEERHAENKPG